MSRPHRLEPSSAPTGADLVRARLQELRHPDAAVRGAAVEALGAALARGRTAGLDPTPYLRVLATTDPERDVREAALQALVGDEAAAA